MYDFYVMDGKKLIDYKPKYINYARAYERFVKSMSYLSDVLTMQKMKNEHTDDFKKSLFLLIKMYASIDFKFLDNAEPELIQREFQMIEIIGNMVGLLTPREFMQLFPVEKEYDGEKYECKDYFYTMNYIKEFGIDTVIGDNAPMFLMEYWNWDVNNYMVYWMGVVNRMNMIQGGEDILIEFMKENGVTPRTLHQEGKYMVDDETGEKFEIQSPKTKVRKLFSVMN